MTPWVLLDSAQVPGNGAELSLYRRNDEFSIKIAGRGELMNSRVHGSEDALWCRQWWRGTAGRSVSLPVIRSGTRV
jgi:hypothetical protein